MSTVDSSASNIMRDGRLMVVGLPQTSELEMTRERRKRRSDLDISLEILRIASDGARKTRIVCGANLNSKIVNKFLGPLRRAGFLSGLERAGSIYRTTEEGHNYIRYIQNLKEPLTIPEAR